MVAWVSRHPSPLNNCGGGFSICHRILLLAQLSPLASSPPVAASPLPCLSVQSSLLLPPRVLHLTSSLCPTPSALTSCTWLLQMLPRSAELSVSLKPLPSPFLGSVMERVRPLSFLPVWRALCTTQDIWMRRKRERRRSDPETPAFWGRLPSEWMNPRFGDRGHPVPTRSCCGPQCLPLSQTDLVEAQGPWCRPPRTPHGGGVPSRCMRQGA